VISAALEALVGAYSQAPINNIWIGICMQFITSLQLKGISRFALCFLALPFGLLVSEPTFGAVVQCANVKVLQVYVQTAREDGLPFQNHLFIGVGDENGNPISCGGGTFMYLPITDPNYNRMMAIAMTASATGRTVTVGVNNGPDNTLSAGGVTTVMLAFIGLVP
jgi:hypothetical protein